MQLGLHRPHASIFQIVSKLLHDKVLEDGEKYEYIPIKPLDPRGPGKHSTPKKGEEPAAADALSDQLKQYVYIGTSANDVCIPTGVKRQTGCLPRFSP